MQREASELESTGKCNFAGSLICLSFNANRNSSKKALTNDLIEGLEKDLERLKRFEENLRIRKLRTMKGGEKIINETDADRHSAAIEAL